MVQWWFKWENAILQDSASCSWQNYITFQTLSRIKIIQRYIANFVRFDVQRCVEELVTFWIFLRKRLSFLCLGHDYQPDRNQSSEISGEHTPWAPFQYQTVLFFETVASTTDLRNTWSHKPLQKLMAVLLEMLNDIIPSHTRTIFTFPRNFALV